MIADAFGAHEKGRSVRGGRCVVEGMALDRLHRQCRFLGSISLGGWCLGAWRAASMWRHATRLGPYFGSELKTAPHRSESPVCPRIFFASQGRAMEVT